MYQSHDYSLDTIYFQNYIFSKIFFHHCEGHDIVIIFSSFKFFSRIRKNFENLVFAVFKISWAFVDCMFIIVNKLFLNLYLLILQCQLFLKNNSPSVYGVLGIGVSVRNCSIKEDVSRKIGRSIFFLKNDW